MRQRPDIFPTDSLLLIFSNIEKVWRFQQTFLDALRMGIEQNRIAETFLEFVSACDNLWSYVFISNYAFFYSKTILWSIQRIATPILVL